MIAMPSTRSAAGQVLYKSPAHAEADGDEFRSAGSIGDRQRVLGETLVVEAGRNLVRIAVPANVESDRPELLRIKRVRGAPGHEGADAGSEGDDEDILARGQIDRQRQRERERAA